MVWLKDITAVFNPFIAAQPPESDPLGGLSVPVPLEGVDPNVISTELSKRYKDSYYRLPAAYRRPRNEEDRRILPEKMAGFPGEFGAIMDMGMHLTLVGATNGGILPLVPQHIGGECV